MKRKQKQKNDLVFKLLKSMNPFFTNPEQKDQIRTHINSFLKQRQAVTPEPSDTSLDISELSSETVIKEIVKAFDIQVLNGGFVESRKRVRFADQEKDQKQLDIQRELQRQKQLEKVAEVVRSAIFDIQADTYRKFKIEGETPIRRTMSCSQKNFTSTQSYPASFVYETPQKKKNSSSAMPNKLQSSPGFWSMKNLHNNSSEVKQTYISPMSTYRHETDKKKAEIVPKKSPLLKLSSNRDKKSLIPSQTAVSRFTNFSNKKTNNKRKVQVEKSQPLTSTLSFGKTHLSSGTQIRSREQEKTPTLFTSSSEKVLKQSHKLDMEIFSSLLYRKLEKSDQKPQWLGG